MAVTKTAKVKPRKRKNGYRPVEKQLKKNSKGWAIGVRAEILNAFIEGYADAQARGWQQERAFWSSVCNAYNAKIPYTLADHEEPPLPLPEYNESNPPPLENLTEEQAKKKREIIVSSNKVSALDLKRGNDLQNVAEDPPLPAISCNEAVQKVSNEAKPQRSLRPFTH